MTEALQLVALLESVRFSVQDEAGLQRAVASLLDRERIGYQREVRLSVRDRVDFMVDGIALELKVKTDPKSLLAQVLRYADHAGVREVIAASTTHHALVLPSSANGKRLHTVQLMRW